MKPMAMYLYEYRVSKFLQIAHQKVKMFQVLITVITPTKCALRRFWSYFEGEQVKLSYFDVKTEMNNGNDLQSQQNTLLFIGWCCWGNRFWIRRSANSVLINMPLYVLYVHICEAWQSMYIINWNATPLSSSSCLTGWFEKQMSEFTEIHSGWERNEKVMMEREESDRWWLGGVATHTKSGKEHTAKESMNTSCVSKKGRSQPQIKRKLEVCQREVVPCMYSTSGLLWGLILNHLCEVQWSGSINESVRICAVMDWACIHTHTWRHTLCSLFRLISLPVITPPIWHQQAWSIMADNCLTPGRPIYLYLALSHILLSVSLFSHRISSLPVSTPSHNSPLPTNCSRFKIT